MRWTLFVIPVLALGLAAQTDPDGKAESGVNNSPGKERVDPAVNMRVVKHWSRAGTLAYSDIWGWSSPAGREFAYVGEHQGIWFVETTDPSNIKEIGRWSAPASTWRDFTNLGPYVYSVSEHHRGIRIIDMRNPDSPVDLGEVETRAIRSSHNISCDPATNHLYVSGTNQGLVVLDASRSRTNPRIVSTWNTSYTHDCCVRRGKAYLANGGLSVARIMDASNPSQLREIGSLNSPGGYSHNVWVSEDGNLLCHTDEMPRSSTGAPMSIWDISNPVAPVRKAVFDLQGIVHNVFIMGRTAYMSHYVNGVQVLDLSDPSKPHVVASYDTSRVVSGFAGCWGVYPFSESGLIYASDISRGLFVLEQTRGHLNRFGDGVTGSNGVVPRLEFAGSAPRVGGSKLRLEIKNLRPNARFYLMISGGAGSGSVFGVPMHVDVSNALILQLQANANGSLSIPAPMPNDKGLALNRFYLQVLSHDTGLSGGFSSSRGMWTGVAR
jgi:choice-of-anchor B domain-containing protein